MDIVTEMHKVVDLRAATDRSFTECRVIDRRAGADFDIVADDDATDLANPRMFTVFGSESETFTADHGVGANDNTIADFGPIV